MAAPTVVGTPTVMKVSAGNAQASYTITLNQATTLGSQLVVISNSFVAGTAYFDIIGSSGNPTTNNGDTSAAETFPPGNAFVAADNGSIFTVLEVYRFASVTAGSTTVTVNYKNSGTVTAGQCYLQIAIIELAGMAASPTDGTAASSTSGTQTISDTTTAGTGDIFFGTFASGAGSGPSSPWALVGSATLIWDQSVASNTTVSFTTTSGTDPYVAALIAYAGVAGAQTYPITRLFAPPQAGWPEFTQTSTRTNAAALMPLQPIGGSGKTRSGIVPIWIAGGVP